MFTYNSKIQKQTTSNHRMAHRSNKVFVVRDSVKYLKMDLLSFNGKCRKCSERPLFSEAVVQCIHLRYNIIVL